ncbi:MAG: Ig-like domain-containing protein [Gemmatimonadaceae bacterium]
MTTLTVNVAPASVAIGKTAQATAIGLDQYGKDIATGPVTWSVTPLASISQTGVVTGVAIGQANVIAVVGELVALAPIAVTAKPAAQLLTTSVPVDLERNGVKLAWPPSVQLVNEDGVAVRQEGVTITASIPASAGTLSGQTTVTSSTIGTAGFSNLVVTGPSGLKTVTLSAPGLTSSTYQFTLLSNVASTLSILSGNNQTFATKQGTLPLSVRVLDADGYGVINVPITWTIGSGGGSVRQPVTTTNADGIAGIDSWTLGTFGPNTLTATAAGVAQPVTFVANATHQATTAQLTLSSSTVVVGQSIQGTVTVFDENGAPFTPTDPPQWFAPGGAPTQSGLIIGTTPGDSFVFVRVGALVLQAPLKVTGIATRKLTVSQAPVSAVSGAPLNPQPVVQLVDVATGQPAHEAGHPVTFYTFGSTSLVGTTTVFTDANGTARFTDVAIVSTPSISGGGDLLFYSDNALPIDWLRFPIVAGSPRQFTIFQGDNQLGSTGKTLITRPAVIVRDATGIPVPAGIPVTFSVTAGSGTVTQATVFTQSGGYAEVGSWTLGAPGLNTLTVTSSAFSGSITFMATARPF